MVTFKCILSGIEILRYFYNSYPLNKIVKILIVIVYSFPMKRDCILFKCATSSDTKH
jgi:hypothetical protein